MASEGHRTSPLVGTSSTHTVRRPQSTCRTNQPRPARTSGLRSRSPIRGNAIGDTKPMSRGARDHPQLEVGDEGRQQVQEVPSAELLLGSRTDHEQTGVLDQELLGAQVREDRFAVGHHGQVAPPLAPSRGRDRTLLQREGEELLGSQVAWVRRRDDVLDEPASPQQQDRGCPEQSAVVGGQEQRVPARPGPSPGPARAAGGTTPPCAARRSGSRGRGRRCRCRARASRWRR